MTDQLRRLVLLGDINLMGVDDPGAPFSSIGGDVRAADMAFANLECVVSQPPGGDEWHTEGYFADPSIAEACLAGSGVKVVGMANNMIFGQRETMRSLEAIAAAGLVQTGAGRDRASAYAPATLAGGGLRFGFLQRSSVFWETGHEAGPNSPGIAVLRGHTAYQVPTNRIAGRHPPVNRPGIAPIVVTWADRGQLARCAENIRALKSQSDIVVASFHWGLDREVLDYMRQIAHAAIDAGADIVVGSGPHYALGMEIYQGKPIFYGLGNASFDTDKVSTVHNDWRGLMATILIEGGRPVSAELRMLRRGAANTTIYCPLYENEGEVTILQAASAAMGAELRREANQLNLSWA